LPRLIAYGEALTNTSKDSLAGRRVAFVVSNEGVEEAELTSLRTLWSRRAANPN
jgi:hypothetical protein